MTKFRNEKLNISNQIWYKSSPLLILGMIMLVMGCTTRGKTRQMFTEIMSHSSNNTTPDWRNIKPGKTTESEFDKIVSITPNIFENLTKNQLRPEGFRYIWYDTEFQLPIGVNFHDNIVSYLDFDLPGYSFPFEDILNIAGSPIAYLASSITEEFVYVTFFYEEKGIVISFYAIYDPAEMIDFQRNCNFSLTESTQVDNINIFFVEQSNLGSMANTLFSGSILPGEMPEPWAGIEDVLKLTSGQVTLEDRSLIDCRNS